MTLPLEPICFAPTIDFTCTKIPTIHRLLRTLNACAGTLVPTSITRHLLASDVSHTSHTCNGAFSCRECPRVFLRLVFWLVVQKLLTAMAVSMRHSRTFTCVLSVLLACVVSVRGDCRTEEQDLCGANAVCDEADGVCKCDVGAFGDGYACATQAWTVRFNLIMPNGNLLFPRQ
eukprot:276141-Rhodomonas_salina.1